MSSEFIAEYLCYQSLSDWPCTLCYWISSYFYSCRSQGYLILPLRYPDPPPYTRCVLALVLSVLLCTSQIPNKNTTTVLLKWLKRPHSRLIVSFSTHPSHHSLQWNVYPHCIYLLWKSVVAPDLPVLLVFLFAPRFWCLVSEDLPFVWC